MEKNFKTSKEKNKNKNIKMLEFVSAPLVPFNGHSLPSNKIEIKSTCDHRLQEFLFREREREREIIAFIV